MSADGTNAAARRTPDQSGFFAWLPLAGQAARPERQGAKSRADSHPVAQRPPIVERSVPVRSRIWSNQLGSRLRSAHSCRPGHWMPFMACFPSRDPGWPATSMRAKTGRSSSARSLRRTNTHTASTPRTAITSISCRLQSSLCKTNSHDTATDDLAQSGIGKRTCRSLAVGERGRYRLRSRYRVADP
jgi:hypothetical protein